MGGHHSRPAEVEDRTPRIDWAVIVPFAVVTLAAMIWMWPSEDTDVAPPQAPMQQYAATIIAVDQVECPDEWRCRRSPGTDVGG